MAWGSYSSTQTTKVWSTTTGWDSSEQFAIFAKWRYASNVATNQTRIILDSLVFRETRQLCLAWEVVTFQGGFSGDTTTGSVTLYQKNSSGNAASLPYDESVSIGKTKVFNNDSNGNATGLYFYWRCSVTGNDRRVPKQTSLQTYSISSSVVPKLALASSISAISGTIGSASTISVTRQNSSYTHTITYSFGSYSETICTKSSSTSISWTPPMKLCNALPNATSGSGSLTIKTYSGNTQIGGNKTATLTLSVPSSVVPSISSVTITDSNAICTSFGVYIAGKSNLTIKTSSSGSYSSTISSTTVSFVGKTWTGSSITTGTFTNTGSQKVTITVKDSRGRTASTTRTLTIKSYTAPKVSKFKLSRCLADGTLDDDDGTYAKVTFNYVIDSNISGNAKNVEYRLMTAGSTSYTVLSSATLSSYSGSAEAVLAKPTGSFEINNTYSISAVISDSFSTTIFNDVITSSYTLINFGKGGESIALMKVSKDQGHLEVNMPSEFIQGSYVHQTSSTVNEGGYFRFLKIEVIGKYANMPIELEIMQRRKNFSTIVCLRFENEDNQDPALGSFLRNNNYCNAIYLNKEGAGTWYMYLQKSENWDTMVVNRCHLGQYGETSVRLTWLDGIVATLPEGYVTCSVI